MLCSSTGAGISSLLPPVLDREEDDQKRNQQREKRADQHEVRVQPVDLAGDGRRRFRKKLETLFSHNWLSGPIPFLPAVSPQHDEHKSPQHQHRAPLPPRAECPWRATYIWPTSDRSDSRTAESDRPRCRSCSATPPPAPAACPSANIRCRKNILKASLRRQHVDRAGVRECRGINVPLVPESHRVRDALDGIRIAGQKMPAIRRLRMAVILHVNRPFSPRLFRRFARVEADRHHVVIFARRERQHLRGPHQSVQDLRAQHRALVIHQRQHHRPLAEILPSRTVCPFSSRNVASSGNCEFSRCSIVTPVSGARPVHALHVEQIPTGALLRSRSASARHPSRQRSARARTIRQPEQQAPQSPPKCTAVFSLRDLFQRPPAA